MAAHFSTLAWKIPWTEEPGRLQSMGSLRVGHDWATSLSLFTFMHWRRKWHPLQCSCLENLRNRGAWWAAICGVAQSRTWLKWLSSSSSSSYIHLKFFKVYLCWLHWIFIAACRLSLVVASRGCSPVVLCGFSLQWLLLLWSTGCRHTGFSSWQHVSWVVVVPELSCSLACGILLHQGSNPCPLH